MRAGLSMNICAIVFIYRRHIPVCATFKCYSLRCNICANIEHVLTPECCSMITTQTEHRCFVTLSEIKKACSVSAVQENSKITEQIDTPAALTERMQGLQSLTFLNGVHLLSAQPGAANACVCVLLFPACAIREVPSSYGGGSRGGFPSSLSHRHFRWNCDEINRGSFTCKHLKRCLQFPHRGVSSPCYEELPNWGSACYIITLPAACDLVAISWVKWLRVQSSFSTSI